MGILTASAIAIATAPNFPVVLTAQTMMALAGAAFGPAIAAITLGILGSRGLAYRMGRNAAFDHAGNVFIAVLAGTVAGGSHKVRCLTSSRSFPCWPLLAYCRYQLGRSRITRRRAGSMGSVPDERAAVGLARADCVQAVAGIRGMCRALFHFANAPMLPLVGQKLALANKGTETALMSACIVAAQVVMLPMALLVGAKADACGRKPILLAALAVLPIRGVLYTLSDDGAWLVASDFSMASATASLEP